MASPANLPANLPVPYDPSDPLFQCGDCGHQFRQLQCHIHANTDGTCAETCMNDEYIEEKDQIHHCPHCHTHNSTWIGSPP